MLRDLEETKRASKEAEKDHRVALKEMEVRMDRVISDAKKDAALATATAVADKERELTSQIRELEKEIARLQSKIEFMELAE